MPPKKNDKSAKPKIEAPQCGLTLENCNLPVWDDQEIEKEQWGDLNATHLDPSTLYTDADTPSPAGNDYLVGSGTQVEWKRPSAIFLPFKPDVVRADRTMNPYDYDPSKVVPTDDDDDDSAKPSTRAEMVAQYREMRVLKAVGEDDHSVARRSHITSKRRGGDKQVSPTPFFMRAFNSALMVLNQQQNQVAQGNYAWELIHPQLPGRPVPHYNPAGKYCVKLFIAGAFRRITIDDRLPTDAYGHCIFSVTENKEIWPALLAKAIAKALTPLHESILYLNPTLILSILLPGWTPQTLVPTTDEVLTYKMIRAALENRKDSTVKEPLVLCASCTDAADTTLASVHQDSESSHVVAGLPGTQLFHILDAKPFQNTTVLHMCSPGANWKGTCGFESDSWTAEVEQALQFNPKTDRNSSDLSRRWNDFWIPWESFVKFFASFIAFRNVLDSKRYACFKQICYVPDPTPEPPKGKSASPPPPERPALPKTVVKWLHFQTESPTSALLALTGLPQLAHSRPSQPPSPSVDTPNDDSQQIPAQTSVLIHAYDWTSSNPLSLITSFSCHAGSFQSKSLPLMAGSRAFQVTVENLHPGCCLSVLAGMEMTLGDEKDICRDILGVHSASDAGVYGEHSANATTLWFKRHITVKQPTTANFTLSTLPKGTDISLHKSITAEAPQQKGKKPDPKASKAQAALQTDSAINDQIDDTPHDRPIRNFAKLALYDVDSGSAIYDVVGKLLDVKLKPNKNGYVVIAFAIPPENYGKGYWKLACTSDRVLDTFETRAFDDTHTKQGEYSHNDHSLLFRYNFTCGENATATIKLNVSDPWGIPFKMSVLHNDQVVATRTGKNQCLLEHLVLVPPEKTAASSYSVMCTLDERYTSAWEEERRDRIVRAFQSDAAHQEQLLRDRQAQLIALLREDPNAILTEDDLVVEQESKESPPSIAFDFSLHSSSPKLDIKEDTSIADSLNAIKASWSKKEESAPAPKAAKPQKGAPVVDEQQVRFTKAKEARERYLANRLGVFLPYSKEGRVVLHPEEEQGLRNVPPKPSVEKCSSNRFHGGFTREGTSLNMGLSAREEVESEDGQKLLSREAAMKLVEDSFASVSKRKEARKALLSHFNEHLTGYWQDVKPEKAIPESPPSTAADEEKAKKPAKGGKK